MKELTDLVMRNLDFLIEKIGNDEKLKQELLVFDKEKQRRGLEKIIIEAQTALTAL